MNDFQIWESEAFLLGLVEGELSARRSPLSPASHDELIHSRLGPFVPDMTLLRTVPLDHLPAGAEELESGGYRSAKYPYIQKTEDGYVAVLADTSRRSLLDLIDEYLTDGDTSSVRKDISQPSALLEALCERSGLAAEFESGRAFGEFLGLTLSTQLEVQIRNSIDGHVTYRACPLLRPFQDQRHQLIDRMMESAAVQRCDAARVVLDTLKGSWCQSFDEYFLHGGDVSFPGNADAADTDGETPDSPDACDLWISPGIISIEIDGAIQSFWICVGLIYRNLQEYANRNRRQQLPRALLLREPPKLHMLPMALAMAERDLHSETPQQSPAEIVTLLSLCVETLVTSLWPRSNPLEPIGHILRDHRHDPDERFQHFARLAEVLQQRYRNDALHHGQSFAARLTSWTEAMYVYSALRLLVELHEQITAGRRVSERDSP